MTLGRSPGHMARHTEQLNVLRHRGLRLAGKRRSVRRRAIHCVLEEVVREPEQRPEIIGERNAHHVSPRSATRRQVDLICRRLCACSQRPNDRCAAENCDELAPSHCLPRGSGRGMVLAQTTIVKGRVHVRFGSKADLCSAKRHVRFTPKSDIKCDIVECPLTANSEHCRHHCR